MSPLGTDAASFYFIKMYFSDIWLCKGCLVFFLCECVPLPQWGCWILEGVCLFFCIHIQFCRQAIRRHTMCRHLHFSWRKNGATKFPRMVCKCSPALYLRSWAFHWTELEEKICSVFPWSLVWLVIGQLVGMMIALVDEHREDKAKTILYNHWGQIQSRN